MAHPHVTSGQVVALLRPDGTGASSRTAALLKAQELEVIRLVLRAGEQLPEHRAPGEITLVGLRGRLELTTAHGSVQIGPNDFVHLAAREPHAVRGVEDAAALLTIALPRPPTPSANPLRRETT